MKNFSEKQKLKEFSNIKPIIKKNIYICIESYSLNSKAARL